MRLRLQ
jgi:hypothetical protein